MPSIRIDTPLKAYNETSGAIEPSSAATDILCESKRPNAAVPTSKCAVVFNVLWLCLFYVTHPNSNNFKIPSNTSTVVPLLDDQYQLRFIPDSRPLEPENAVGRKTTVLYCADQVPEVETDYHHRAAFALAGRPWPGVRALDDECVD